MDFLTFLFVPTIVFLAFLGPIWVVMHYTTRRREAKTLLSEEQEALDQLVDLAARMESRVTNLEKILDTESPDWRSRQDNGDTPQ